MHPAQGHERERQAAEAASDTGLGAALAVIVGSLI